MKNLWCQILVWSNALLLALPPGWCCFGLTLPTPSEQPKPVPQCCCTEKPGPETPPQQQTPTPPLRTCCCEKTSAVTPKPEKKLNVDFTLVLPVPVMVELPPTVSAREPSIPVCCNLPLHVRQCVWRC